MKKSTIILAIVLAATGSGANANSQRWQYSAENNGGYVTTIDSAGDEVALMVTTDPDRGCRIVYTIGTDVDINETGSFPGVTISGRVDHNNIYSAETSAEIKNRTMMLMFLDGGIHREYQRGINVRYKIEFPNGMTEYLTFSLNGYTKVTNMILKQCNAERQFRAPAPTQRRRPEAAEYFL